MQKSCNILIFITVAILIALTVCGSIWDLKIAEEVYIGQMPSENMFGIIFSYIGIIPTFVGWSFLGASILFLSKKQIANTRKRRTLMAFAILLLVLSFFYYCNTLYISNSNAFKVHFAVVYAIGIAVICSAAHLGFKLSEKSDNVELLKKALFLAAVSLLTLFIISITKELMCRPRFRLVLAMDDVMYFKNWWESGRGLKDRLGTDVVTDEFASFPSGHSAYSMFAIFMFPFLADYTHRLKKFKPYLFVLGFLWWGLTAFSRLTVGAHYLTDVAIAGLVTILAYAVLSAANYFYMRKHTANGIKDDYRYLT